TILTMNFRKVTTTTNNLTEVTVARFVAFVKKAGHDTSRCWHLSKVVCFRRKFRCQGIGHFAPYCKAETAEVRSLEEAQTARVPSSEAARTPEMLSPETGVTTGVRALSDEIITK